TDIEALFYNKADTAPAPDYVLTLEKVYWKMPEIKPSDAQKAMLLRHVEQDQSIAVAYRNWEIHEYPLLPQAQLQTWTIKTTTELEKPRYVVLTFQTAKKGKLTRQSSKSSII